MTKCVVTGYIRESMCIDIYNEIVMLIMEWLVILVSNTMRLVANRKDHRRLYWTRTPTQPFYFRTQGHVYHGKNRKHNIDTRVNYTIAMTKWGRFELYLTKQSELYLVLYPNSNIKFINVTIKTSEHRYQSKFHNVREIDLFSGIDNAEWIGRLYNFYSQQNINTIMQSSNKGPFYYPNYYNEIVLLYFIRSCLSKYYQEEMRKILWNITIDLLDIDYIINVQVPLYLQINYIEYKSNNNNIDYPYYYNLIINRSKFKAKRYAMWSKQWRCVLYLY